MSIAQEILEMARQARAGARQMALLTSEDKNQILQSMADRLVSSQAEILEANAEDMRRGQDTALSAALLDRLQLTPKRFQAMVQGLREVAALPDPVGELLEQRTHENGMILEKRRVPIGVIGIIYESRPNVTADAAGLCLKSGNAPFLRGGKEAFHSNRAIFKALRDGANAAGLPAGALQWVATTDREAVRVLCQLKDYVDLIIPRGGESLIEAVVKMAHVPVIKHSKGLCHIFVDACADLDQALEICVNAKCQRPGVCNAMETLLVHKDCAPELLPKLAKAMPQVELRGCPRSQALIDCQAALEEDWHREYLDLILSVKVVDSVNEAIEHIANYGSQHSDAILSQTKAHTQLFSQAVDSAAVYVNASTRFTDGGQFGMGAEIGISTDKLHARGPMGLPELTTYKYLIRGQGQVRR